jgi:aspartyl-tRNA(Asn)/glutamyl-tRNA(Gln) amidotransferase subunit C
LAFHHDDVRRIAELARLEISDAALPRLAAELSAVLDFVAALNRLELAGLEPSTFAPTDAPLRDDVPDGRRLTSADALAAAPEHEAGFFLVPPIVEHLEP